MCALIELHFHCFSEARFAPLYVLRDCFFLLLDLGDFGALGVTLGDFGVPLG